MRRTLLAVATAAMLVTAGCAGLTGGDANGTVSFYVSDQQHAMDDFEHLNVTVTEVAYRPAGEDNSSLVTRDVDDVRVDLTQLKGENATLVGNTTVPAGNYTGVFVRVTNASGVLESGDRVDVKVPSDKLHVNSQFEIGDGESVSFVYDITVVKAGGSGKYVIQPVVGESGTNVPIQPVDATTD